MIKKLLIYSWLILLPLIAFSQSTGDYRSVNSGNWITLSSWQYFNGSIWVTPSGTSPQGYPGQFLGTGAVLIQAGNTITMGQADLTTQVMGTLTINGTLNLDGGASGVFTINTQNIIVTSGLTPYANISFANKVTLALPANASIQVGVGGLPTPGNGTCNNNIEISIGGSVLAYCTGSGSPKADYTFTDLINNGGYNFVNATASPSLICGSGSSTITALAIPSSGAIYKWYNAATGGTLLQNGGNVFNTNTISSTTTYYVDASYTSPAYTTVRKAVTVSVNPLPTVYTVTGGGSYCMGGTGVAVGLSNSTFGVNYQLQIGGVNTGTPIAGNGSAISFGLKTTTGTYTVIATNATTNCSLAMSGSVSVIVNPSNTVTAASSSPVLCSNTLMTNITHSTANATGIGTATGLPAGITASWSSNTITISGTPTASGTFNYTISLTGGCGSVNATGTITVNASNTVTAASSSPVLCSNTLMTNITHSTTNATGIGTVTGLPAGLAASWASNTITISGTPTASGTFNYTIPLTGGCGSVNATGTITVNASNTVTAASSSPVLCSNTLMTNITHSTTNATGIGTVTGLPAGLAASWASNTITIIGTPTASGTFNYTIPLTGGCGSVNATGTITVNTVPIITTQPISQLDCEGASVSFNAVAVGSGLTYTWQYKKTTDASFLAMPATNVTYPSVGKVTIANVGSAQFPDSTQFQVIVSNGSCSLTSNPATLSVNSITGLTASPAATPSITNILKCFGASNSYTVTTSYPSNIVSYQWKKSVTPGVWTIINNGGPYSGATTATLTITGGTPAESAEYRVYITFTNSTTQCSVDSSSRQRSLTFYPLLTTPVATITPPDCSTNTGTIAVTVQSATDVYSFDNGLNYQASNIKSGLTAGTYDIFIKNIGGCISPVKNATIIAPLQAVWNGSWTNGPPTSTQAVVFNNSYTIAGDMEACSCQVNSGSVTVNPGVTLKITNGVTVAGGTLTFEDSASLVQINNVSNSGNIRYSRGTQGAISNFDYTYWSSPVSPQTLFNVSPQTLGDKFFSFNGATDSWVQVASSTVMGAGIGYIIRGPQTFMAPSPPSFYQATFIGVPNNGTISIPIGTSGEASYLLGNPYPSALDGETFIKNNSILDGTLYFWTHGTKIGTGTSNLGSGLYAYTSDDYASFNLTGGAAASSGGAIPTGKIGSGQGFFVTIVGSGSVNFANTMRVGVGGIIGNNSQFFKTQPSAKTTALEKNRLWLDFFNEEGAFKQALIGYVSGASNDLDMQYDGESFDANEYVDFYSILNNKNLVIQGRAVPFDQEDKVLLGYKTTIEGEFTIKIKQFDGLFDTQDVFIEDKLLNIKYDLKKEGYTFTTAKGTFDDRFVLFYANAKGITATTDLDVVAKSVLVSTTDKVIKIASSTANIEAVKIFDLSGKEVFNKQKINSTDLSIRTLRQGNTVYVVKIKLDNGQTLTQKVIY